LVSALEFKKVGPVRFVSLEEPFEKEDEKEAKANDCTYPNTINCRFITVIASIARGIVIDEICRWVGYQKVNAISGQRDQSQIKNQKPDKPQQEKGYSPYIGLARFCEILRDPEGRGRIELLRCAHNSSELSRETDCHP
jgi:hypothetical protein